MNLGAGVGTCTWGHGDPPLIALQVVVSFSGNFLHSGFGHEIGRLYIPLYIACVYKLVLAAEHAVH